MEIVVGAGMSEFDPASVFEEMAARIRRNPGDFSGAYVVVGPENTVVQNALFSPSKNVATFWGLTKTHISLEADNAAQAAEAKNQPTMYGRR